MNRNLPQTSIYLLSLIVINALVFLFFILLGTGKDTILSDYINVFGAFAKDNVSNGYLWTFVTSAFLHFTFIHIAFNLLALYQIGRIVELFYSGKQLFITFILGAVVANFLTYIAFVTELLPNTISIGASGGVFALLGLLIGGILKKNRFGVGLPIGIDVFIPTLVLSVLISFMPNVNFYAHLGGFGLGVFLGIIFENNMNQNFKKSSQVMVTSLYYISLFLLIGSYGALIFNLLFG